MANMRCCLPTHNADAARFFSRTARRYRRRIERKGLEPSSRQLAEAVKANGIDGVRILEIGCGVGGLHQWLLMNGAATAVGVDLSEEMLREARSLATARGLGDRTEYHLGDYIGMANRLGQADAVVLDKVICCTPDAGALVNASVANTRRTYAFTVPRERWFVRIGVAILSVLMRLMRSSFRPYLHDLDAIEKQLRAAGFERYDERATFLWLMRAYRRA
jgi:magnesium-protoporphyrin O-methyltransferase